MRLIHMQFPDMVVHLQYILTCDINAHKPSIKQTTDMFSAYSFLRWAYPSQDSLVRS